MIIDVDKQTAREDANAAFEDAHIYVHFEAFYILPLKKGGGKGDDRWIGAAQEFLHISRM